MDPQKISALDVGLLVIRIVLGAMFFIHGWGKLIGGPEEWQGLGGAMGNLGITFAPTFWGFMAAFAECVGGVMLAVGLFVRPFAALLFFTMFVASVKLIRGGEPFLRYSRPVELAGVFLGLVFTGGGRVALGAFLAPLRNHWFR
jgi:putative oxidoreductase